MFHSEMVERVARAICRSSCDSDEDFEMVWGYEVSRRNRRLEARAAIASMREPTDAMAKAGVLADDKRTGNQTCRHIYRSMISAALADETMTAPSEPKPSTGT